LGQRHQGSRGSIAAACVITAKIKALADAGAKLALKLLNLKKITVAEINKPGGEGQRGPRGQGGRGGGDVAVRILRKIRLAAAAKN